MECEQLVLSMRHNKNLLFCYARFDRRQCRRVHRTDDAIKVLEEISSAVLGAADVNAEGFTMPGSAPEMDVARVITYLVEELDSASDLVLGEKWNYSTI